MDGRSIHLSVQGRSRQGWEMGCAGVGTSEQMGISPDDDMKKIKRVGIYQKLHPLAPPGLPANFPPRRKDLVAENFKSLICVCVCVAVCEKEKERPHWSFSDNERPFHFCRIDYKKVGFVTNQLFKFIQQDFFFLKKKRPYFFYRPFICQKPSCFIIIICVAFGIKTT